MSFGGLFEGGDGCDFPSFGGASLPALVSNVPKPMFGSAGLSLGLRNGGEGVCRSREDDNESSDNLEGVSGDDFEENPRKKKKRYHRHTPNQIQELEALFKECPHPDEKQRMELSRRLGLETRQVKFWFQNRRTQMKTQMERHENSMLRAENDKLRAESLCIRDAMRNPICSGCGGPAVLGEVSPEEQQLRVENARLKDELDRVCSLAGKFLGRPVSSLELGFGLSGPIVRPDSALLDLALSAADELVKMAEMGSPLWINSSGMESAREEALDFDRYEQLFPRCVGIKDPHLVSEATRETAVIFISALAFVEALMDSGRWADMFPGVVARTVTTDVISSGVGATMNGALQLMYAELQVLSPLVPIRQINFLRFCKQLADGAWTVVDVSVDGIRHGQASAASLPAKCCRLPSGCVVQSMPDGYSKVTWVEHTEYDESAVHQLCRPLVRSGLAFGSRRWVSSLQRGLLGGSAAGRRSLLRLARRMTDGFCAGMRASPSRKWARLANVSGAGDDVRVMTRQSADEPGEPPGVVLSAATSVWVPASPRRLLGFLRDESLRSQWDVLSSGGGPMQEVARVPVGDGAVSLLRSAAASAAGQSGMLILQETCEDSCGSTVVYAPVDVPAMHAVMNGADPACVPLLPSGFAVLPDGDPAARGALLTVAFQILVNSLPTAKLTVESVETVNSLISCTVQRIKSALQA